MFIELLTLAQADGSLITMQERLLFPLQTYPMQLVCSMLIGAVLGLLGCFVVLRRMALIGDAISHAVLPGVVIAFLLLSTGILGLFSGALVAGIVTAIAINLVTRFSRVQEDSAIGIVFTAMFALGIILISRLPAGVHFDMKCFLFGDPLAVQRQDLIGVMIIAPIVTLVIVLLFHPLKLLSFDPMLTRTMGFNADALHYTLMILLAATIVAALRSVGVIMAVAMLITPAAFAYQITNRLSTMLLVAALAGAGAAGVGMFLSFLTNDPSGPVMVLVATALFLLAMAFGPQRGFVTEWLRRRRIRAHIVEEDVLKALGRGALLAPARDVDLARSLAPTPAGQVQAAFRRLSRDGLVAGDLAHPTLTSAGRSRALEMVRSHRLWETYLAYHDVDAAYVHDEAERLEHAHDVAEELAVSLGEPTSDPHGQPIPRRLEDER